MRSSTPRAQRIPRRSGLSHNQLNWPSTARRGQSRAGRPFLSQVIGGPPSVETDGRQGGADGLGRKADGCHDTRIGHAAGTVLPGKESRPGLSLKRWGNRPRQAWKKSAGSSSIDVKPNTPPGWPGVTALRSAAAPPSGPGPAQAQATCRGGAAPGSRSPGTSLRPSGRASPARDGAPSSPAWPPRAASASASASASSPAASAGWLRASRSQFSARLLNSTTLGPVASGSKAPMACLSSAMNGPSWSARHIAVAPAWMATLEATDARASEAAATPAATRAPGPMRESAARAARSTRPGRRGATCGRPRAPASRTARVSASRCTKNASRSMCWSQLPAL